MFKIESMKNINQLLNVQNKKIIFLVFLIIGTSLYSPFINNHFTYDDYLFVSLIEEKVPYNPFYGFWSANFSDVKVFESMWWVDEDAESKFFRPIPSLVISEAYGFWGKNSALPLHLFSIILHCINAFLVYVVLNRLSKKPNISLTAGFIYLICVHHALSVGWISTNTDLIAVFFMLLSIYFYIGYREKNKVLLLISSLLAQLFAFGCKETASITSAAIILYELIFIPVKNNSGLIKTFLLNWKHWSGSFILTAAFLVFYKAGGFGINSLLYYDPFLKPLLFIQNLFIGYPLMFLGLLSIAPFSFPAFVPELLLPFVILGLILLILFLISLFPFRKDKVIIFCFALFVISILPQLSADATERQLYFPYAAGSFIISFLIFQIPFIKKRTGNNAAAISGDIKSFRYVRKWFSYYLLISSVIISFLLMFFYPKSYSRSMIKPEHNTLLTKEFAVKKHTNKIIMLNLPDPMSLLYMSDIYRFHSGRYIDFFILYGGNGRLWFKKTDDRTISLKTDTKGWLTNFFSKLPRTNPLFEKQQAHNKKDFTATIIETTSDKQDVLEAEFNFKNTILTDSVILFFDGKELKELDLKQININEWIFIADTSDVIKYLM